MSYKVSKKEAMELSDVELVISFDKCITALTNECNSRRGETKITCLSYNVLKNELLLRMGSTCSYDTDYKLTEL